MNEHPEAQALSFVSGIHRIDARLHEPAGTPKAAIVVAHPHPMHGGNMDHGVVVATCEQAAALGLLAMRFDFRGVQASEGDTKDLPGHLDDWRSAHAELARRLGSGPVLGAGFSYGSRTLAAVLHPDQQRRPNVAALLLLAPATRVPTTRRDFGNLLLGRPLSDAARDAQVLDNLGRLSVPTQVLVGENDVVAPHEELGAALAPHAVLHVLPGLNHFFSRHRGAGALARDVFVPVLDASLRTLMNAVGAD